jgi:cytochrome c biogenesis protein CcmG, thiol:disulfide interchange protein DsbE
VSRRWQLVGAVLAAAIVAVVVVGVVLADEKSAGPVERGESGAPAAEALELSGTDPVTGNTVSFADFEGKPIVLNFWASWCPPCREELPALIRLAEAHPEAAVVGVNYQDDPASASQLQREIGFRFPSIADPQGEIGARLGIQGMPTTYFLDEHHRVIGLVAGGTDLAGFEQGLELATRTS